MNRTDKASALLKRAGMALALLLANPVAGHAAGFDCRKAASGAEKAICADATLSRLDGDLAAAWKRTLAEAGDAGALKASQRDWLTQRDACGSDTRCLVDRYHERLSVLGNARFGTGDRWQQTWSLDTGSATSGGQLTFTGTPPTLHFTIGANAGAHTGELEGDVVLHGERATFRENKCQLDFRRQGARIHVTQTGNDGDCGAGMGVYYDGDYVPASTFEARSKPDLLSLKVVTGNQQNAAARALLGKDYVTLVDIIDVRSRGDDEDALGANVSEYFVRGIANTNAAIVMSRGDRLWIGMLVFDARNQVRMRYYTNVPAWKKRVPRTIQAWRDRIDSQLPIDLMR